MNWRWRLKKNTTTEKKKRNAYFFFSLSIFFSVFLFLFQTPFGSWSFIGFSLVFHWFSMQMHGFHANPQIPCKSMNSMESKRSYGFIQDVIWGHPRSHMMSSKKSYDVIQEVIWCHPDRTYIYIYIYE